MPDKRENIKSRYTGDRATPGAFEGETVTRRRFMVGTTHLAGAGAALAFTLPALAFALGPVFERQKATWEDVGPESAFNPNTYVPVNFTNTPGIGDVGKTTAYVRRFNPALDGSSQHKGEAIQPYVAISTRCAHLGCPVRYAPAASRSAPASRSTPSSTASRPATRPSRSTASASTRTRPASRPPSPDAQDQAPLTPARRRPEGPAPAAAASSGGQWQKVPQGQAHPRRDRGRHDRRRLGR